MLSADHEASTDADLRLVTAREDGVKVYLKQKKNCRVITIVSVKLKNATKAVIVTLTTCGNHILEGAYSCCRYSINIICIVIAAKMSYTHT